MVVNICHVTLWFSNGQCRPFFVLHFVTTFKHVLSAIIVTRYIVTHFPINFILSDLTFKVCELMKVVGYFSIKSGDCDGRIWSEPCLADKKVRMCAAVLHTERSAVDN